MTIPSEHIEQVNFVNWVKYNYPEVKFFAPPNGAHLNGDKVQKSKQMNKLKSESFSKGVPDIVFPSLFLYIEMKKQKGGTVSQEQKDWIEYLQSCGYIAEVCRGADEARELFKSTIENTKRLTCNTQK